MIMHNAVKALVHGHHLLESQMRRENFTQLPFCQPAADVHAIATLPSRLRNPVFTFFKHSFAADVASLSEN